MSRRYLLVSHNAPPMIDRAHDWLLARGDAVDVRRPFLGDPMPDSLDGYAGTIVYGGPFNGDSEDEHPFLVAENRWIDACLDAGHPLLGICQGAQMMAWRLGAAIGPFDDNRCEFGFYEVRPVPGAEDFLPGPMLVTQSHFHGFDIPEGGQRLAESDLFPNQAFRWGPAAVGVQFHPEATAAQFRLWQERYPGRYAQPGCQTRAEQDALMDAAQAPQAAWFDRLLADLFGPA